MLPGQQTKDNSHLISSIMIETLEEEGSSDPWAEDSGDITFGTGQVLTIDKR